MVEIHKSRKTALLFGNTGLTGSYCQDLILSSNSYDKLITFGRRPVEVKGTKHIHHVIDFSDLHRSRHLIQGDDLFLCLGTTMDKAGSKEAFYDIDYRMNHEIAELAEQNGVKQLLLVSAVGADPESMFFYNEVKGKLEASIMEMEFWATHIFQPSVILGKREENRPLESIAQVLIKGADRLVGNILKKYKPVSAKDLAKAMTLKAQSLKSGKFKYPSHQIVKIANQS